MFLVSKYFRGSIRGQVKLIIPNICEYSHRKIEDSFHFGNVERIQDFLFLIDINTE